MFKKIIRSISTILVFVLLVNMIPAQALGNFNEENAGQIQETDQVITLPGNAEQVALDDPVTILGEIPSGRTEYSKEFLLSNGLHMMSVYAEPVHYLEDGQWNEINNTLRSVNGTYQNTAGVWEVSFPQQVGNSQSISITKDGYTLSFGMPEKLTLDNNVVARSADAQTYRISQSEVSTATVTASLDVTAEKAEAEFPETVLDGLASRMTYQNIHTGTDVIYDLTSNKVKESVVLKSYDSTLRGFRYTLNVGAMQPKLIDDGAIEFYDETGSELIMVMPAPYLLDDAMDITTDVQVSLTGKDGTYILTYTLPQSWLADPQRQWPVILDPVIQADLQTTNIRDTIVGSTYTYNHLAGYLDVGYEPKPGIKRSFVKYTTLPTLNSSDVIVSATMTMRQMYGRSSAIPVEVHKVKGVWESQTLQWTNMPDYDETVEDFVMAQLIRDYTWDVTDIVQEWYRTGMNTGMMFKATDEVENAGIENFRQFYSSDYGTNYKPELKIIFRSSNGLESYWDYTSASAGRAGNAYINNYCGNLVFTRELMGFDGNRAPVSIYLTYNANDVSKGSQYGFGNGWRSNYNQRVYRWSQNSNYYIWEDEDGTQHYFEYESYGTYEDEDGLELTLTTTGSGTQKYAIRDVSGNTRYFDTYGRLRSIVNNQQTKSTITITYKPFSNDSLLINTITDGAGRVYQLFYYNAMASNLVYTGTGTETIAEVLFTFDSGKNLTNVTDIDGNGTVYTYNTKNLLTSAQDVDGYQLAFDYNLITADMPSRVIKITEKNGSSEGSYITFSYDNNQTSMTDKQGASQILQFNNYGNITSVQDDQGRAQFFNYTSNKYTDTGKGNQLILSSNLQNTVSNLLDNSSFENENSQWYPVGNSGSYYTLSETEYCFGNKALQISAQTGATTNGFSVANNQSITFSAYVKTGTSSARLELTSTTGTVSQSEILAAGDGWVHLQTSYTNTTGAVVTVAPVIRNLGDGNIYADAAQLEYDLTANRYNLIQNGDFRNGLSNWTATGTTAVDGITTATAAASQLDNTTYRFVGDPESQKKLSQTIAVNGVEGDSFVLAGWAKGDSVPLTGNREFGVRIIFNYSEELTLEEGETDGTAVARFNADVDQNWQFSAVEAVASAAYNSVTVELVYDYNANEILFDGIMLFRERFGTSYEYDANGQLTKIKDAAGETTTCTYSGDDLTGITSPEGEEATFEYDNYNNLLTSTENGFTTTYQYDVFGNNTSVTTTHNESNKSLTTSTAYSSNGNYIVSSTDELGNVTKYSHNADTGVLEWTQYPQDTDGTNGTPDTRTYYTYDGMYRVIGTEANTNTGLELSANYTYTNDLLTSLHSPSTTYGFAYNQFAQIIGVSIGSQEIISYEYDSNNRLNRLDYTNGGSVQYTYDAYGNIVLEQYEDGASVSYLYDTNGLLVQRVDSATGITTNYTYDSSGQLINYAEVGPNYNHSVSYTYNEDGQLISETEIIGNSRRVYSYVYDDNGRLTSMSQDNITITYIYDVFDRVCTQKLSINGVEIHTNSIVYAESGSTTSQQVSEYNGFTYTYDSNGNILSVNDGTHTVTYAYDTANQLVRENNPAAGYTHTWTYNNAGNILFRKEYAYTTGDLIGITPLDTVAYTYGNENWGDLLTAYDGKTITYDANGNPLNDGTWSYTWQHGRQLASMSSADTTWTYTYNADGLRTKRTDGLSSYTYIYDGDKLTRLIVESYENFDFTFTYDANGVPLTITDRDDTYYYITNLQGDVIGIKDSSGQQVVTYSYDAWGNLLYRTNIQLADYNPLRYRGYVYDMETELYYLQSRYYNPELGRFINADDVAFLDASGTVLGNNLFAYCENNPVNSVDLGGFFGTPIQWLCATIGGICGWLFGDYVARAIGLNPNGSFWSRTGYWTVRGLVVAGGSILGYIAGTKLLNIITKFIYNKGLVYKLPTIVRWFLGIPAGSQLANDLYQRYASHIFSADHIKNGIMKLGSSQRQIFDRIFSIVQSCMSKAQNGSNQIYTYINGYKVTIRFFFKDGTLKNIDAFIGWASRKIGNIIWK